MADSALNEYCTINEKEFYKQQKIDRQAWKGKNQSLPKEMKPHLR